MNFKLELQSIDIQGTIWTPSKVIRRLGEEIDNPESIYYWAAKNKIPVFSPALTDGSLGDMMFFHSYSNPGLVIDILSGTFNFDNNFCKRTRFANSFFYREQKKQFFKRIFANLREEKKII